MTVLLIAGSGGHLTQLKILAERIPEAESRIWVTDRTPQSESLLENEKVIFLPHQAPRSIIGLLRNAWILVRRIDTPVSAMYSTGAGIALSGILASYVKGARFTYIESATRVSSLSLTGRIISRLPKIRRFVQHRQLAIAGWKHIGSVFDGFSATRSEKVADETRPLKVLVTVGANQHAGFERFIHDLYKIIPSHWSTYWQYGPTNIQGLAITGSATLSARDMIRELELADVVVSHAGTGSILSALMAGKVPIVVPRSGSTGEHVDEHQMDLANFAARHGLAMVRDSEAISLSDLLDASQLSAQKSGDISQLEV